MRGLSGWGEPGDGRPSRKARMWLREKDRDPGLVGLRRHQQNQVGALGGSRQVMVVASPRASQAPCPAQGESFCPAVTGLPAGGPGLLTLRTSVSLSVPRWKARWFLPVYLQ